MDHKAFIQSLIEQGNLKKAIEELLRGSADHNDLNSDIILLSARFNSNEREMKMGLSTSEDYKREKARINYALSSYLDDYTPQPGIVFEAPAKAKAASSGPVHSGNGRPKVFISYRHADREQALKVKSFFENNEVEVLIDMTHLKAGGNIKDFIIDMIKRSDATISLVSTRSLDSPWVSIETDFTLNYEMWADNIRFVACSLDAEFFQTGFVNDRLKSILKKIKEYEAEKQERREISDMLDTSDLDGEIERHRKFMQDLPKIITRLKEHLTVDISDNRFEDGMQAVIRSLKEKN